MNNIELEIDYPEAFRCLPAHLKSDDWKFFVDVGETLCAVYRHSEYVWCDQNKKWYEIPFSLVTMA